MSVVFCSNKAVNLSRKSGVFCLDESLNLFVFALPEDGGALRYISDSFEFEVENPLDMSRITNVQATSFHGMILTFSSFSQNVFLWDLLRPMEGMSSPRFHKIVTPSKPKCILARSGVCYLGLENGKIFCLDLQSQVPPAVLTPRLLADVDLPVTCMQIFNRETLICGTSSGTVKCFSLLTKKFTSSVKPPPKSGGVSVVSITVLEKASTCSKIPALGVCFTGSSFSLISSDNSSTSLLPLAAKSVFTTSVSDPQVSPLIVHTDDNRLLRMDGPNWSHQVDLMDPESAAECLALYHHTTDDPSTFAILEQRNGSLSQVKKFKISSGLGPLVSIAQSPPSPGSLSLSDLGRAPFKSVSLGSLQSDKNLAGFVHSLTGKWISCDESIVISVFNSPPEIAIVMHSPTSAKILKRFPVQIPPLSVITAFEFVSQNFYRLTLGFSSGQAGILAFSIDSDLFAITDLLLLPAVESVHAGAKIVSVDTCLVSGNLLTTVDINGMVSFVRIDNKDQNIPPAHVAIGGDYGACFPDPRRNVAYMCMEEGTMERISVPKRSDEMFESEVCCESLPLNGRFVALFAEEGILVRESGIVIFSGLSRKALVEVKKVIPLNSGAIVEAIIHKSTQGKAAYVVVLTDSDNVMAFDCSEGVQVFNRAIDAGTNPATLLEGSCYAFRWAESLTPLLFHDRSKALTATESIIMKAQDILGFPVIKGVTLLPPEGFKTEDPPMVPSKKGKKSFIKTLFSSNKSDSKRDISEYKPTQAHLDEARAQMRRNLDAMEKLQADADEMQNASADFLQQAQQLNKHYSSKKKFLGIF